MTFLDQLILATLNEWQGTTLTAEQIASIIKVSDIDRVRNSLEMLTESHVPVIKNEQGYTIPNSTRDYISGIAIFTTVFSLAVFL